MCLPCHALYVVPPPIVHAVSGGVPLLQVISLQFKDSANGRDAQRVIRVMPHLVPSQATLKGNHSAGADPCSGRQKYV
jgi:hypothetical protein